MTSDLLMVWVGESDGRDLYRIYNKKDYERNQARVPLGRMTVEKGSQATTVTWERPVTTRIEPRYN